MLMGDFPLALLTAIIWAYWFCVGAMIVHVRRATRHGVGLVPEQRKERSMWLLWVPLVVLWMLLPYLALTHHGGLFSMPEAWRREGSYIVVRGLAAAIAVFCLLQSIRCWRRMGKHWRMDVSTTDPTVIITDGPFRRIRHPIYSYSMLLMICSAIIAPSLPILVIAVVHLLLMNIKARNEERHLLQTHGDAYARYLARTGRFFPRLSQGGT